MDYRILEKLGDGGMGTVYRARQASLDRVVALKMMLADASEDATLLERFHREVRLLSRLDHPHIVPVIDSGMLGGKPYFVMELAEGPSLGERIEKSGPLESHRVLRILLQASDALEYLHEQGIRHRDVKPRNLILAQKGDLDHVVLVDFGLASAAAARPLTEAGGLVGTMAYLAPEVYETGLDTPARDVWALVLTALECCSGRRVFEATDPAGMVFRIGSCDPEATVIEHAGTLPLPVRRILMHGLSRDPGERPSARELHRDLRQAIVDSGAGYGAVLAPSGPRPTALIPDPSAGDRPAISPGATLPIVTMAAGSPGLRRAGAAAGAVLAALLALGLAVRTGPKSHPAPSPVPVLGSLTPDLSQPWTLRIPVTSITPDGKLSLEDPATGEVFLPRPGPGDTLEFTRLDAGARYELVLRDGAEQTIDLRTIETPSPRRMLQFAALSAPAVPPAFGYGAPEILYYTGIMEGTGSYEVEVSSGTKREATQLLAHPVLSRSIVQPGERRLYRLKVRPKGGWGGLRSAAMWHSIPLGEKGTLQSWVPPRALKVAIDFGYIGGTQSRLPSMGFALGWRQLIEVRDREAVKLALDHPELFRDEHEKASRARMLLAAHHPEAIRVTREVMSRTEEPGSVVHLARGLLDHPAPELREAFLAIATKASLGWDTIRILDRMDRPLRAPVIEELLDAGRERGGNDLRFHHGLLGLAYLRSPDAARRIAAEYPRSLRLFELLDLLVGMQTAAARAVLARLLRENPPDRRILWATARLHAKELMPEVLRLLESSKAEDFRHDALLVAALIGGPEAGPALRRALEDPRPLLRRAACWGLGWIRDRTAAATIRSYALSPLDDSGVGAWALARLGETSVTKDLERLDAELGRAGQTRSGARRVAVLWAVRSLGGALPRVGPGAEEVSPESLAGRLLAHPPPVAGVEWDEILHFPFLAMLPLDLELAPDQVLWVEARGWVKPPGENGFDVPVTTQVLPRSMPLVGLTTKDPVALEPLSLHTTDRHARMEIGPHSSRDPREDRFEEHQGLVWLRISR